MILLIKRTHVISLSMVAVNSEDIVSEFSYPYILSKFITQGANSSPKPVTMLKHDLNKYFFPGKLHPLQRVFQSV